ncbi:hypothetical protein P3T73_11265 [Kiritimatiellota bacterium B12222]|nr:hypothetical protein P3T73_11265 [Kiritimatiellota bacterium B12222]
MKKNEIIALVIVAFMVVGVTLYTKRDKELVPSATKATPSLQTLLLPPPPALNNPLRLEQTYQPGKVYRATTDYKLQVPGQHTRWGIRKEMVILLTGRFQYDMKVLENDGKEMSLELTIRQSRFLQMAFDANIELELDKIIQDAIQVSAAFYGTPVPAGAIELTQKQINHILKQTKVDSQLVEELLKPDQWVQEVESLEGAVVRMRYLDGEGVRDLELIKYQTGEKISFEELSKDEQSFLMNFHPFPDPYIFPDEAVNAGETWLVNGSALPIRLPMILNSRIEGTVTLSRQTADQGFIPLTVEAGKLYLQGNTQKGHQLQADWTPRGYFQYNPDLRIVASAQLNGGMTYASGGKDFWVLQVSQSARPEYELEYSCEVDPSAE